MDAVDSDADEEEIVDVEAVEDHVVEPSATMRKNGVAASFFNAGLNANQANL